MATVDKFHIGHIIFGVVAGLLVNLWCPFCLLWSPLFWLIFPAWEIIERTVVARYFYPKGWIESPANMLLDIILGIVSFEITLRLLSL